MPLDRVSHVILEYDLTDWTRPEGCVGCIFTRVEVWIAWACPIHGGVNGIPETIDLPPRKARRITITRGYLDRA